MKRYADDLAFLASNAVETVELIDQTGRMRVCLAPHWQGRVLTSTTEGINGRSLGWLNRELISARKVLSQFNPVGGEERFWLGPEGGPNALYFDAAAPQEYTDWQVPAALDTEPFDVVERRSEGIDFARRICLRNARGTHFEIGVDRSVRLLTRSQIERALNVWLPAQVSEVAYQSQNRITNCGPEPWTAESGAPSVWMLSMFPPTPTTVVFLPFRAGADAVVRSGYFGRLDRSRLLVDEQVAFFRCDGTLRSKIGLPAGCDSGLCGSYDAAAKLLTLLLYTPSTAGDRYVDSCWGRQTEPFAGDVVNAYNDGPTQSGEVMGPFYELETSSPAAFLQPGQQQCHAQTIVHLQGDERGLDAVVRALFRFGLFELKHAFKS